MLRNYLFNHESLLPLLLGLSEIIVVLSNAEKPLQSSTNTC